MTSQEQHQTEILRNRRAWESRPLLREIYEGFYRRIGAIVDTAIPGRIVELGSGIGNLKSAFPRALCTDLFPNPWIDLACDAYELPFDGGSISNLVLFDVFHHLRAPMAFMAEARRVLAPGGRLILFEPYISLCSFPVYGLLHHEPVAWSQPIDFSSNLPGSRDYYAAQGNATRLFFREEFPHWRDQWKVEHAEAFSAFHYLFSGGYSKPAIYPRGLLGAIRRIDDCFSKWPNVFGARCIVALVSKEVGK